MTTREEARGELEKLGRAVRAASNPVYMRWETLTEELRKEDFPYLLEQVNWNDIGDYSRKNLYYWRNRSWDGGALYINETAAGKELKPGVMAAVERLKKVLEAAAA